MFLRTLSGKSIKYQVSKFTTRRNAIERQRETERERESEKTWSQRVYTHINTLAYLFICHHHRIVSSECNLQYFHLFIFFVII